MKYGKAILVGLCLTGLLTVSALASHSHIAPTVSPWAGEEVNRAASQNLLADSLPQDYRQPITRAGFCDMALQYVAVQKGTDLSLLVSSATQGESEAAFTDCENYPHANAAKVLGIVEGRGNGIFDPDGNITREEAAVMLTRAYTALGGELPQIDSQTAYTDSNTISGWARDSVAVLKAWDVMHGMGQNQFSPKTGYTAEQCILTFLRLSEKAPVSRAAGNVTTLFTPEQAMDYVENRKQNKPVDGGMIVGMTESIRLEGPAATLIRLEDGGPHMLSVLYLVGKDGSLHRLDIGLCYGFSQENISASMKLENAAFNADGTTLTFSVTLPGDQIWMGNVVHEKGTYQITADVATGVCRAVKTA